LPLRAGKTILGAVTTEATPLVLLVLLAFFFVVALAFTVWAALTVGDAAKRRQQRDKDDERLAATRRPAREPKPWERKPDAAPRQQLWVEQKPQAAKPRPAPAEPDQQTARAVVTPRPASPDAFERFLESEKRRD